MFRIASLEDPLTTARLVTGNQVNEGGSSGLRRSLSQTNSASPGYCNISPSLSSMSTELPPPYSQDDRLPPSRFKILPREEEGREELPPYSCSLHKEAVFDRKMELRNPFERSTRRQWKRTYLILHGTKLEVYRPKQTPFFSDSKTGPMKPVGWLPGKLIESYTLQLAEVGTATDYKKRHFVIRLRVQTVQFLLSCRTLEAFLEWLEALSAAIDLAPSLEERSLPRYQTLPRRRRRRPAAETSAGGAQQQQQQQQMDLIRSSLPNFAEGEVHSEQSSSSRSGSEHHQAFDQESTHDPSDIGFLITPTVRTTAPIERRQELEDSSLTENGKWAPRNAFSREAQMRYAHRCMAVLCADAPRQSDYVVVQGQRYRLMWESKMLVPDVVGVGVLATAARPSETKGKRPATSRGRVKDVVVMMMEETPKLPRLPEYEEVVGASLGALIQGVAPPLGVRARAQAAPPPLAARVRRQAVVC